LSFCLKSRNFYDSRSYGDSGDGIFSLNRSCLDTSRYRIQQVQEDWGYRRYTGDTGDTVDKGDTGDTGDTVDKGGTGDTGDTVNKGSTGDTVDKGGDTGDTVNKGGTGDTGDI